MKILTVALSVLVVLLSVACAYLYFGRARYVPIQREGVSPFVALDTRTGMAWWTGPPQADSTNLVDQALAKQLPASQNLERGIANQLRALRDGYSPAITADLAKLEQQLSAVRERLKVSDPQTVKLQMRDTRRFVDSRLRDLSVLWDGEPRIAREEIVKHVGRITLKPMLRTYSAMGVWDWLGVLGGAATMVVPGARAVHNSPRIKFRIEVAA